VADAAFIIVGPKMGEYGKVKMAIFRRGGKVGDRLYRKVGQPQSSKGECAEVLNPNYALTGKRF